MIANFDAEREFLNAIAESPEDDSHRLIYADWLEEQGDARGELVRVQVELARLGKFPDPQVTYPLKQREEELWGHLRPLREHFHQLGVLNFEFRRGVLEGISINGAELIKNAEQIFQDAPALRSLDLIKANTLFNQIGELPQFQQVRRLQIGGRLEAHESQCLNRLIAESTLTDLEVSYLWSSEPIQISSPINERLRSLVVRSTALYGGDYQGAFIDLRMPDLPQLQKLSLSDTLTSRSECLPLLQAISNESFRSLSLAGNTLARDVRQFVVTHFPKLQVFESQSPEMFDHLSDAIWMRRLWRLNVEGLNDQGMTLLLEMPWDHLRELKIGLQNNVYWPTVLSALCDSYVTPQLYHLELVGGRISQVHFDKICDGLSQVPGWEVGSRRTFKTRVATKSF